MERDRPPAFLLVDDNPEFTAATASLLQRLFPGARAAIAPTGVGALRALTDDPSYDVVLLDYQLPDLDGLELVAELRNRGMDVAVVMITGEGDEEVAADLFRMGASDYLVKSRIDRHVLQRTLESVLDRRRLEGEVRRKADDLAERSLELDEKNRALEAAYNLLRSRKEQLHALSEDLERLVAQRTQELQRTTEFLNRILDASPDHFIVAADDRGQVLRMNRGARLIFGLEEEEVVGRLGLSDLLRTEDGGEVLALTDRARLNAGVREEMWGRRQGGALFPCRVDFAPLKGGDGITPRAGVVVLGTDTTQERLMAEQLRAYTVSLEVANRELQRQFEQVQEATRLKSEFIANISHELRTPLNAVIGYADLMRAGIYGPVAERQTKAVNGIYERANDLLRLINDILDVSRIEAGRLTLQRERFEAAEVVEEVAELARLLARGKPIRVETRVEPEIPALDTDLQKLKQILFNLASNAVKFTIEGTITFALRAPAPGRFEVAVIDSGIGISTADQRVIFDAFRQLDGSVTRKHGGTGLGLSISRAFARFLGGDLRVESVLGSGSTFVVDLPCSAPEGESASTPAEAKAPVIQAPAPPAIPADGPAGRDRRTPAV